jgi:hypothetical protein
MKRENKINYLVCFTFGCLPCRGPSPRVSAIVKKKFVCYFVAIHQLHTKVVTKGTKKEEPNEGHGQVDGVGDDQGNYEADGEGHALAAQEVPRMK